MTLWKTSSFPTSFFVRFSFFLLFLLSKDAAEEEVEEKKQKKRIKSKMEDSGEA